MNQEERLREIINSRLDCPNCDNVGFTVIQTSERRYVTRDMASDACEPDMEGQLYSDDEFEQEQCEFCYREENSKFNLPQAILKEYIYRDDVEKVSVIGLQRKFKVDYHEAIEMIRYFKKGLTTKE